MTLNELIALDQDRLKTWVLLRVREREMDPPPASRKETPADYVIRVYNEVHDIPFASRLEKAVLDSLIVVGKAHDLFWGKDVDALEYLSNIVMHIRARAAYPLLLEIANLGTLGGHLHVIDGRVEEALHLAINAVRPHDRHPLPPANDVSIQVALEA
jgi:hypothetical protein